MTDKRTSYIVDFEDINFLDHHGLSPPQWTDKQYKWWELATDSEEEDSGN